MNVKMRASNLYSYNLSTFVDTKLFSQQPANPTIHIVDNGAKCYMCELWVNFNLYQGQVTFNLAFKLNACKALDCWLKTKPLQKTQLLYIGQENHQQVVWPRWWMHMMSHALSKF